MNTKVYIFDSTVRHEKLFRHFFFLLGRYKVMAATRIDFHPPVFVAYRDLMSFGFSLIVPSSSILTKWV